MNNVKINSELGLSYPDGFKEMGEAELTRYFSSPANRWGAYNDDEHIILSVSWAKAGFLRSDPEMFLSGVEARMRLSLLNYQRVTEFKTKIAGKKAYGIRFEYRVNDKKLVQVADMVSFKYKKNFYTVHYITRKLNAASSRPDFLEVLKSVSLG